MNDALLSSKKMDYCTPRDFFAELDKEFHFSLDAAATVASAKCEKYFTPETDGLHAPWTTAGGGLSFVTRLMGGRLANGCVKPMKRQRAERPLFCSYRQGRTRVISTNTYWDTRKLDGYAGACALRTKMARCTRRRHFRQWSWCTTGKGAKE